MEFKDKNIIKILTNKLESYGYIDVEIKYGNTLDNKINGASFTYNGVDISNKNVQNWLFKDIKYPQKFDNKIKIKGIRRNYIYFNENSIINYIEFDWGNLNMMEKVADIIYEMLQINADFFQKECSKKICITLNENL